MSDIGPLKHLYYVDYVNGLKTENARHLREKTELAGMVANLRAEIERLRADNEWLRKVMYNAIAAQDFSEARRALEN